MTNEVQGEAGDARGGAEAWRKMGPYPNIDWGNNILRYKNVTFWQVQVTAEGFAHCDREEVADRIIADHTTVALAVEALREIGCLVAPSCRLRGVPACDRCKALARIEAARGEATHKEGE